MRALSRAAVRLEEDLHAVDGRVEGVRAERAALDRRRRLDALNRRLVDGVSDDIRRDRELDLANVADGDGVRAAGRLDDRREGAELAVLDVHTHLARRVVRAVPELNVGIERAALGREHHLNLLNAGERYDHVRSEPPWTRIEVSAPPVGTTLPRTPPPIP